MPLPAPARLLLFLPITIAVMRFAPARLPAWTAAPPLPAACPPPLRQSGAKPLRPRRGSTLMGLGLSNPFSRKDHPTRLLERVRATRRGESRAQRRKRFTWLADRLATWLRKLLARTWLLVNNCLPPPLRTRYMIGPAGTTLGSTHGQSVPWVIDSKMRAQRQESIRRLVFLDTESVARRLHTSMLAAVRFGVVDGGLGEQFALLQKRLPLLFWHVKHNAIPSVGTLPSAPGMPATDADLKSEELKVTRRRRCRPRTRAAARADVPLHAPRACVCACRWHCSRSRHSSSRS